MEHPLAIPLPTLWYPCSGERSSIVGDPPPSTGDWKPLLINIFLPLCPCFQTGSQERRAAHLLCSAHLSKVLQCSFHPMVFCSQGATLLVCCSRIKHRSSSPFKTNNTHFDMNFLEPRFTSSPMRMEDLTGNSYREDGKRGGGGEVETLGVNSFMSLSSVNSPSFSGRRIPSMIFPLKWRSELWLVRAHIKMNDEFR